MTTGPFASLTVGLAHWGNVRQMAGQHGLQIEESKGLLTRTFVLRGTSERLNAFYSAWKRYEREQERCSPSYSKGRTE